MTDLLEVEAANAAFYAAVEHADAEAMARLWDEEQPDGLTCVHPGWPALRGRGPVLRSWSALMAGTEFIHFLLTDVAVLVDGDVAVVTCVENVLSAGVADEGGAGAAVATNVFRRRQDGWRLVVHHAGPLLVAEGEVGS